MQEELNEIRTIYKLNVLSFSRCDLYRLIAASFFFLQHSIKTQLLRVAAEGLPV